MEGQASCTETDDDGLRGSVVVLLDAAERHGYEEAAQFLRRILDGLDIPEDPDTAVQLH